MGSRRTAALSAFGNGRSSNGNNVSGRSRPSGCSYLSNVRPENRSTLCSVMAQLAEEMPPSFVTTLKSRAVSESCNVKFACVVTGHPVPQITWYKDDKQMDRYCGLPKYEIFHNGQNHSLHIYNCTMDDAAIYQASAINSKGIVSCSGVLEVGEMNEFKIHQRYFAKLKQKVENKCKETQGKENLEPLRTISPDRTQRKRRSTTEAFVSTPSPTENEGSEEIHQAEGLKTECMLQKGTVEEVYKNSNPDIKEAMCAKTTGHINNDPGNKSRTYMYDPDHKIFTSQQPKSPFVMKKIKISDSATPVKPEGFGERKMMEDDTSSAVPICTKTVQAGRNSEEVMEVESIVSSSLTNTNSKNIKGERGILAKEDGLFIKNLSKDGNMFNKRKVPSQQEIVPTSEFSIPASPSPTVSEKEGKKIAKHTNEGSYKETEKCLEKQKQVPHIVPAQNKSSNKSRLLSISKEDTDKTGPVATLDTNVKSNTSLDGSGFRELVDTPCDTGAVSLQCPCEWAESLLPEKETSPCQKKESQPAVPSEVTKSDADMNWNDAPVGLKLPLNQNNIYSELPQKTDDMLTSPLSSSPQTITDEIPQDASDASRKPNGSCSPIFTRLQKSAHEIPSCSESIPQCNVAVTQQSQVDTAIKTFDGTEIQEEKLKVGKVGKFKVQTVRGTRTEKILEVETSSLHEKANSQKTKDVGKKEKAAQSRIVDAKKSQSTHCEDSKEGQLEIATRKQLPENTNTPKDTMTFTKIPKTESKVISVSELLRSQIKALKLTQDNPVSNMPVPSKLTKDPLIKDKNVYQQAREESKKCKPEVETIKTKNETETTTDRVPETNLKETLMKVYQQLNEKEQEHVLTSNETSTTIQTLYTPVVVPSTFFKETHTATDINMIHGRVNKSNEDVMDTSQETVVPLKDYSIISWSESKNVNSCPLSLPSEDGFIKEIQSISNPPETNLQKSGSLITAEHMENNIQKEQGTVVEHTSGGTVQVPNMATPISQKQLNDKLERVSEQYKIEKPISNSFQTLQAYHQSEHEFSLNRQVKDILPTEQESLVVKEGMRPDPFNILTPEFTPLLKQIDVISPIPSATPQELASGARRKIPTSNAKTEEAQESTSPTNSQTQKREMPGHSSKLSASSVSPSLSRRSPLLHPAEEQTSVEERQSPLLTRKKMASETQIQTQRCTEKILTEGKPTEKDKHNPFKAPQVIRKIRAEAFADGSGHLRLWCQFFNVLSDSNIKWYKDEEEIAQVKKNAGDETQVNLAIVQASCKDSGVYGCSITNEYGSDTTDFLLSADILAGMSLREDLGVGEEIEMTPLMFNKGLADSGIWGNKFFGRIIMMESQIGDSCSNKIWRAKVIYGLEPVFESGNTCIIKIRSPITYAGKEESLLIERNQHIMKQECRNQNLAREYCKIFSAEARVIENFGPPLEIIPVYLMYRPANPVPYATVETDLIGVYKKYSVLDNTGRIDIKTGSEVEQKCCALQHWIFQWTAGNLLLSRLEGVDTKITNVGVSVKSTGHQGLCVEGKPKVFDQFVLQHKCNYFCGLLGLRSLKVMDFLSTPTKLKGSKSPLLQRKKAVPSSSPQTSRKAAVSPRMPKKAELEGSKSSSNQKDSNAPNVVNAVQT
ncbi:titin homolog [Xiphophorus couchianus]|uniref:titin homolog n=1 Tax=Xiphophorus couchianus TaxID=32473 RepID=UPI001015ECCC|nr:titin homolog [Xiphophorus couchianus]XP_027871686.1 titin homolog [Xiphophorus couchianus]